MHTVFKLSDSFKLDLANQINMTVVLVTHSDHVP